MVLKTNEKITLEGIGNARVEVQEIAASAVFALWEMQSGSTPVSRQKARQPVSRHCDSPKAYQGC